MLSGSKFSDLKLGDSVSFEIRVSPEKVHSFAELVGDFSPLHMDEGFARQTQFSGRIVHGMLLASHFSTLVGMYLPGRNALYLGQEIDFIKPVPVGEQILNVVGTLIEKHEATRTIIIRTEIVDLKGQRVVGGKGRVMVLDPYEEKLEVPEGDSGLGLGGKTALVTGASRGIGAHTALMLARHGARVVINHKSSPEQASKVATAIEQFGGQVWIKPGDVADNEEVERVFNEVRSEVGGVDILINNAAPQPANVKLVDADWAGFQRDLDVILKGSWLCSVQAARDMAAKKAGAIVNLVTTYATGVPPVNMGAYIAAKSALLGLTKSMAVEWGPIGIRVNGVAPGLTDTALSSSLPQRFKDLVAHQTPLKRIGQPLDTARAILFLVSDASSFINGAILPVCGGYTML